MASKPQMQSKRGQTITFRCDPDWKRKVLSAVALRGEGLEMACVEAMSKHLKVPAPKVNDGAAA